MVDKNSNPKTSETDKWTEGLSDKQKNYFIKLYNRKSRFVSTGVLSALALGNFGVHRFYLHEPRLAVLYCFFSWTGIPYLISLCESVLMPERVRNFNEKTAQDILIQVKNTKEELLPDTVEEEQKASLIFNVLLIVSILSSIFGYAVLFNL